MPAQFKILSNIELHKFMNRVNKMRKEGFSLCEIARYYYISRSTLMARIKKFELQVEK